MRHKGLSGKVGLSVLVVGVLVILLFFSIFSFRKSRAGATARPYRFDRYSGITVMNANQAEAIMLLRHVNAPMAGEMAPNSEMFDAKSGRKVTVLSLLKEKPMVLIFGSASCTNLENYISDVSRFCDQFGDKVDFAFVYLREAHPEGGFMPNMTRDGVVITRPALPDPKTMEEKRAVSIEFQKKSSPKLRVFVDSLEDEMAVRWGAWPDRVFVIDPNGEIMYAGGPGPFYFQFNSTSWHSPPPPHMDTEFQLMPFSRISLEEFLIGLEWSPPDRK